ncbi:hypothetical protein J3E73DRAFT_393683 [Bipolaris maydis]|nr:hypothetical protein J3E73DRAFT_393683 [Bipolaris maydis]
MATPVLPDTSGLECTVIIGPEFQCSASPNGSITIQTNTGPIIILLHRIADQRRIQINPVHQQRIPAVPFLSGISTSQTTFWFAENSGSADTQRENSNGLLGNPFSGEQRNAEAFNSTTNELEEGVHANLGGDEYIYNSASSSGNFNKIRSGKRSKPLSSDEGLKEFCRKLSTKILEQWKSRHKDDQSLKVLLSDWNTIFGQINYSSPREWSYQTIIKAETLGGLHLPFHKMILATWWNSCLERRTSEVTARIKKQMVLALEPGFDSFDAKVQDSKRKQIDRCIIQGNVITLMFNRAPGLVITAARSINTTEYEILWKNKLHPNVSRLDWLSEELIKDSQLYLEPVLTILHFLSKIFDIQPQSPNPQANFSLPQSRIETESQTDAASSSCRAIHSPKEPVPSYQISLCGQKPSEDSIETIANTAKRRKISRYICLQSPKYQAKRV